MLCCEGYEFVAGGDTAFEVDAARLAYGSGVLREAGTHANDLGMRRVALFTDKTLARLEPVATVAQALRGAGLEVVVYAETQIEPSDASFRAATEFARDGRFDGFVSVGGGSVIDTCKAANLYATHPAEFSAYVNAPLGLGNPVPGPLRPHIACPTTSGTGSEVTGIAIFDFLEHGTKTGIASKRLRPTFALVDPDCTLTLPKTVVACSGFDVLSHALESYTALPYTRRKRSETGRRPMSQGANPFSDLACLEALRILGRYIVRAVDDAGDGEARERMMFAATLAGIGFGNAGVQVPQALTDGFRLAYLIGAGLAGAAALVTFTALPKPARATVPAARRLAVAIGVVVAGFVAFDLAFAGSHGAPVGAYTLRGAYTFVSAPSLHPPKLRTDRPTVTDKLAPGYIFTANFYDLNEPPIIGQSGPLILDRRLQPVWFEPVPESVVASNLSLQAYQGRPALAWWQGVVTNTGQTESGEDVVVNQHYQPVARLKGADGWTLTLHEFAISGEDAWVTANKNLAMNLSKYGGAYNGALIDSAVQEYNLRTGKLLRTWDALDHIPLNDSYATLPTNGFPWDAYHVNSVQLTGNGSFLVSMRNTWAAYLVNIEAGKIEWTLGGKSSSFKLGPGAAFQWQHDVELAPGSEVTMYDDHCCQLTSGGTNVKATGPSRALVLELDQQVRTATLVAQYTRSRDFAADYMGDAQSLPGGNVFVGWGSEPYLSEFSRSGKLLLDGEFPWPDLSYRSTLEQWVGLPLSPPAGAARQTGGKTTVYASWNGATGVLSWRVLAGPGASRLAVVATTAKSGFETAIPIPQGYRSFKVEALNANGRVIGASRPFTSRAVR